MPQNARSRSAPRRSLRPTVIPLAIAAGVVIASLLYQATTSSARSLAQPSAPDTHPALPRTASLGEPPRGSGQGSANSTRDAVTEDDGVLPDGVTALDDEHPGVTNLDPDLRAALRQATSEAERNGVELDLYSGWRSAAYQDELLRDAIARYGSRREAARWVATADTSPHVAGEAVDVGSSAAWAWLSRHGAAYGLCAIYRNEPWHFELRATATHGECPPPFADPTDDPRMGA